MEVKLQRLRLMLMQLNQRIVDYLVKQPDREMTSADLFDALSILRTCKKGLTALMVWIIVFCILFIAILIV